VIQIIKRSASISIQYDNIFSPFSGSEYEKGLDWVQACGFEGAELIFSDPELLSAEKIRRQLEDRKLRASTLATGQATALEGLAMTSAAEHVREATMKRIWNDIDFSVELGRPNVTIGLIRGRGGVLTKDMEYELLKRELAKAADYALKKGVTLNIEPINRYECALINSSEAAFELIMEIGNPTSVGILYDTFHSNIEDADIFKALTVIGSKISHVHFADSNRRLPGEGHVDFPRIICALRAQGYSGYASLEVLNTPSAQHVQDHAKISIEKIFKEADKCIE
jgi:sugar phosphate isomerase/epimerase